MISKKKKKKKRKSIINVNFMYIAILPKLGNSSV